MRGLRIAVPGTLLLVSVVLAVAVWSVRDTHASTPLTPNLQPLKASSVRLDSPGDGHTYLLFSTTSWNSGLGPLEIIGGATDTGTSKQQVDQRIYNSDGTFSDHDAGSVDWHDGHGHIHFNDYALYTLDAVSAPGASLRTARKTTFCIVDTTRVKLTKISPRQPFYATCGAQVQGMSQGWGDTYGYFLDGQSIDVTGLPDGDYTLTIKIDPKNRIIETNDADNTSVVTLHLAGGAVTVPGKRK